MLKTIEIGENYTRERDCMSVEVLEFKTIELENDDYCNEIEVVVYIDEDSNVRAMEIKEFGQSHC